MIVKTPKTRLSIYGFLVSSPLSLPFFLLLYFPLLFCFLVTKIMIVETYSYHFLTAKRTPWERENDKRLVT